MVAPKFSNMIFSISTKVDNWPPDRNHAAKQLDQTVGRFETLPRVISALKKHRIFTRKKINLKELYLDLQAYLMSIYIHQLTDQQHHADAYYQATPPKYKSPFLYESKHQDSGQDI